MYFVTHVPNDDSHRHEMDQGEIRQRQKSDYTDGNRCREGAMKMSRSACMFFQHPRAGGAPHPIPPDPCPVSDPDGHVRRFAWARQWTHARLKAGQYVIKASTASINPSRAKDAAANLSNGWLRRMAAMNRFMPTGGVL